MKILGLTGSVAMGKTEAAKAFARLRVPVFIADAAVHELLARDRRTIAAVRRAFPKAATDRVVDRAALGARVFGDASALAALEAILHPRVRAAERRFIATVRKVGAPLAVLEIPLLFETGAEALCDAVAVVSAPAAVQRRRALARPGMTPAKLRAIAKRQMPDREKRRRADFVIDTGGVKHHMLRQVREIVKILCPPQPAKQSPPVHARSRPRHRNHRA